MAHLHPGLPQRPQGHLPAGSAHNINPNDPHALVQFAIGPINCSAELRPQRRGSPMEFQGMYFDDKHTFVVKKAGIGGRDDWRCFDAHSGRLVYNSHHPGKNPYEALDPLGIGGPGQATSGGPLGVGGEWESLCDVSGLNGGFKIRPKKLSMHGRQIIKTRQDRPVFSVAKQSRIKTMSLSASFVVAQEIDSGKVMGMGSGSKSGEQVLVISSDLGSRTLQFHNMMGEMTAVAQKPPKTLILNAAFGIGSEMQLEIAPGVDCTFILAAFLGLQQAGEHVLKDALGNFVVEPLQDQAVGEATGMVDGVTGGWGSEALGAYGQAQGYGVQGVNMFNKVNQLLKA